jgi:hypothetical protein
LTGLLGVNVGGMPGLDNEWGFVINHRYDSRHGRRGAGLVAQTEMDLTRIIAAP